MLDLFFGRFKTECVYFLNNMLCQMFVLGTKLRFCSYICGLACQNFGQKFHFTFSYDILPLLNTAHGFWVFVIVRPIAQMTLEEEATTWCRNFEEPTLSDEDLTYTS
jgi:hypothetical protein